MSGLYFAVRQTRKPRDIHYKREFVGIAGEDSAGNVDNCDESEIYIPV